MGEPSGMARGHIRIRRTSDGRRRYQAIVPIGLRPDGNPRHRSKTFDHRNDAEAWRAEQLVRYHAGDVTRPSRLAFRDHLSNYLAARRDEREKTGRPALSTLIEYERIHDRHVAPSTLGAVALHALRSEAIDEYLTTKIRAGLKRATALRHYALIHASLEWARRRGELLRNPCDMVLPPEPDHFEARIWDEEQTRLFLAALLRDWRADAASWERRKSKRRRWSRAPYALGLYAAALLGLREAEWIGAPWRYVHLELGVLEVRQTIQRRGGVLVVTEIPKEQKPRFVPIPDPLATELRRLREIQRIQRAALGTDDVEPFLEALPETERHLLRLDAPDRWGLVFCQANGKPLHAQNMINRYFHPLVERLKLPRIRPQDLRAGFISHGAEEGISRKVIQEIVGHRSDQTTSRHYERVVPAWKRDAVNRIAHRLLGEDE